MPDQIISLSIHLSSEPEAISVGHLSEPGGEPYLRLREVLVFLPGSNPMQQATVAHALHEAIEQIERECIRRAAEAAGQTSLKLEQASPEPPVESEPAPEHDDPFHLSFRPSCLRCQWDAKRGLGNRPSHNHLGVALTFTAGCPGCEWEAARGEAAEQADLPFRP